MSHQRKPSPPPSAAGVARVPMTSTLPEKELQRYRDSGSVIELQPGEILFEQDSPPDEMYAVLRGTLTVIMDGVQMAEISEGQVVGEMAFLLGETRSATVRALTRCEVHAISPQKMRMLLQHPDVTLGLLQLFSRRVEAANRALLLRTQTATSARLRVEELEKQLVQDTGFLNGELGTAHATIAGLNEQVETAKTRIAEIETKLRGALANLEAADARIAHLEALHPETKKVMKVFSPVVERSALELEIEIDNDLDLLAPPPALPIGKIGLKQVAVPRPKPAPVFTEEGPTEKMEAVPEPLPNKRRDETLSYRTERAEPLTTKSCAVPVGGRTQTMVAFDPDAPMTEIVINDRGSRPAAVLESETDALIREIVATTPDD